LLYQNQREITNANRQHLKKLTQQQDLQQQGICWVVYTAACQSASKELNRSQPVFQGFHQADSLDGPILALVSPQPVRL
jgi:hypothetical protein